MKKVIFDVDTGVDDAVAILLGVLSKKACVEFFCSVSGNTSAPQSAKNTLDVLELISAPQIDVVVGTETGFKKTRKSRQVHGKNGLGGFSLEKNPRKISDENFVDKYVHTLENSKKPITIIALGPLSNIAKVLKKRPDLEKKIEKIVFMGSTFDKPEGDTPYAGFNVALDPEAVEFLLSITNKLVFCPNNHGRDFALTKEEVDSLKNINQTGKILADIFKEYHDHFIKEGASTYDSTAVFSALFPHNAKTKKVFMEIKYYEKLGTALSIPHFDKTPNAKIITKINGRKMKQLFFKFLKTLP